MHQVDSSIYDKSFFENVYGNDNNLGALDLSLSKSYYEEMAELVTLDSSDNVVDYGCGNGNLSFFLFNKYKCNILGLDYSKSAISIANRRLDKIKKKFPKVKIKFVCANNDSLPSLKNIKAVYFCDVIEHMYEPEIDLAIKTIKTWDSRNSLKLIFHTDNNVYLKYVRPFLDLIGILLGKQTFLDISDRKRLEDRVHINLTNPFLLRKRMTNRGLKHISTSYPSVTKDKINKQLSKLNKVPFLTNIVEKFLQLLPFLSPSFFSVYEFK